MIQVIEQRDLGDETMPITLPDRAGYWDACPNSGGESRLFIVSFRNGLASAHIAGGELEMPCYAWEFHDWKFLGVTVGQVRDELLRRNGLVNQ